MSFLAALFLAREEDPVFPDLFPLFDLLPDLEPDLLPDLLPDFEPDLLSVLVAADLPDEVLPPDALPADVLPPDLDFSPPLGALLPLFFFGFSYSVLADSVLLLSAKVGFFL